MNLKIDMSALQKDLRNIGVAIVIASLVSALFEEAVPLYATLAGITMGIALWVGGLIRKED